jgi:hypothetical protein
MRSKRLIQICSSWKNMDEQKPFALAFQILERILRTQGTMRTYHRLNVKPLLLP